MPKATVLYCLNVYPGEGEPEGEVHDEWFTSLEAAKRRRAYHIAQDPTLGDHPFDMDYAIYRVTLAALPRKRLALAILNRQWRQFVQSQTLMVDWYRPTRNKATDKQ